MNGLGQFKALGATGSLRFFQLGEFARGDEVDGADAFAFLTQAVQFGLFALSLTDIRPRKADPLRQ